MVSSSRLLQVRTWASRRRRVERNQAQVWIISKIIIIINQSRLSTSSSNSVRTLPRDKLKLLVYPTTLIQVVPTAMVTLETRVSLDLVCLIIQMYLLIQIKRVLEELRLPHRSRSPLVMDSVAIIRCLLPWVLLREQTVPSSKIKVDKWCSNNLRLARARTVAHSVSSAAASYQIMLQEVKARTHHLASLKQILQAKATWSALKEVKTNHKVIHSIWIARKH